MTKADIINEVAIATGMPKKEVGTVVEALWKRLRSASSKRRTMYTCVASGSFNIKHRAAKTARNISKNTTITIPAHDLPSFKAIKELHRGDAERSVILLDRREKYHFYNNNILKF